MCVQQFFFITREENRPPPSTHLNFHTFSFQQEAAVLLARLLLAGGKAAQAVDAFAALEMNSSEVLSCDAATPRACQFTCQALACYGQ
jgi:hypothetical protein